MLYWSLPSPYNCCGFQRPVWLSFASYLQTHNIFKTWSLDFQKPASLQSQPTPSQEEACWGWSTPGVILLLQLLTTSFWGGSVGRGSVWSTSPLNFFKSDDRLQWTSPPLFSPLHPHNSVLSDQYKYWSEAREKPVDSGVPVLYGLWLTCPWAPSSYW